jgi:hypothetical protein
MILHVLHDITSIKNDIWQHIKVHIIHIVTRGRRGGTMWCWSGLAPPIMKCNIMQ